MKSDRQQERNKKEPWLSRCLSDKHKERLAEFFTNKSDQLRRIPDYIVKLGILSYAIVDMLILGGAKGGVFLTYALCNIAYAAAKDQELTEKLPKPVKNITDVAFSDTTYFGLAFLAFASNAIEVFQDKQVFDPGTVSHENLEDRMHRDFLINLFYMGGALGYGLFHLYRDFGEKVIRSLDKKIFGEKGYKHYCPTEESRAEPGTISHSAREGLSKLNP